MNCTIRSPSWRSAPCSVVGTRPRPSPLAFVHATVHTATGPALEDATLVVDGGRIVCGDGSGVPPPAGAQIVDCTGKHVWPGIVRSVDRLGLIEVSSVRGTHDDDRDRRDQSQRARRGRDQSRQRAAAGGALSTASPALVVPTLGMTVPAPRRDQRGSSALIHLDGWTREDMTVEGAGGAARRVAGDGHLATALRDPPEEDQKKAREEQIRAIRNAFDDARAYWKARRPRASRGMPRHDQRREVGCDGQALRGEDPGGVPRRGAQPDPGGAPVRGRAGARPTS